MSEAHVLGPIGELRAHALAYAAQGLEVFQINPRNKRPIHSQYAATTDPDIINEWWERNPNALIGHRIATEHIITDIDPRHGGLDTWFAIKRELDGVLPITRVHVSGRGDAGSHFWWERPTGKLGITRFDAWAQEHGTGKQAGTRWTCGVDLLHHDHRYTILPPSPHPDTHQPYQWLPGRGIAIQPAPMPALLAKLVTVEDDEPKREYTPHESDPANSPADWYSANSTWTELLTKHGWRCVGGDGEQDGSKWRHPNATAAFSATVKHGCLFVYSTSTTFKPTNPSDPNGYTKFRAYAELEHQGDLQRAARAVRDQRPDHVAEYVASLPEGKHTHQPTTDERIHTAPGTHLPEVFWNARDELEHIRTAARSRYLAPDAVLGAVLARLAALTPWTIELPPTIGSAVGLSFFTALCGSPEAGKSTSNNVAAELLPAGKDVLDRLPLGSGEGMVEALFELVEEPDENGKARKVKRQTKYAAIFYVDEGDVLTELGGRRGSTLLSNLRTAWTHGTLGNTNASVETRRIIHGTHYVYGVVLGIQPEKAAQLLADANAGTPQRFLWLAATDPDAVDDTPNWPGPLTWQPPPPKLLEQHRVQRAGWARHQMRLAPNIVADVKADRLEVIRGDADREEMDAHRMLGRLKVAAILAILDQRMDVNGEDWQLADLVMDTSRNVRRAVENTVTVAERRRIQAAADRHSEREIHVDNKREERAKASATRSVAKVVARHATTAAHPEGCTRRCLTNAIAGKHRDFVSLDGVIADAESKGWIEQREGRWHRGGQPL